MDYIRRVGWYSIYGATKYTSDYVGAVEHIVWVGHVNCLNKVASHRDSTGIFRRFPSHVDERTSGFQFCNYGAFGFYRNKRKKKGRKEKQDIFDDEDKRTEGLHIGKENDYFLMKKHQWNNSVKRKMKG